jgi:hypothetical protein
VGRHGPRPGSRGAGTGRRQRDRQLLRRRVGHATGVDDRWAGPDARRGTLQGEPRSALRLVPATRLLRHHRPPAHAPVRHDRGPAGGDRRRLPGARQRHARRGHARPAPLARGLPGVPLPGRAVPQGGLLPDLRRRGGLRDDHARARPGPGPAVGRGGGCRPRSVPHRHPLGPAGGLHVDPPGVRRAGGVRDGGHRPVRRRRGHGLRPLHHRQPDAGRGPRLLPQGRGGRVRRGGRAAGRRRVAALQPPRRDALPRLRAGIAHVVEVVRQLRGEAANQVDGAEIGIYGGYTGPEAATLVLRRSDS